MKRICKATKRILISILGMLILFSMFSSLVPAGHATGGYPEYVSFTRTKFHQDWNDTQIAAANGATADNMGVTLQVFMKHYTYQSDPGEEDYLDLSVLAFALDRDEDIREISDYLVKELKITMKKMSIENDNGFDWYDVYTWTGNYFINDDKASIDTQYWRNYNLSMTPKADATWVLELIAAGVEGALGTVIVSLPLGIALSVATTIAEMGLEAIKDKESVYKDDTSWQEEYEPAFYKGINDDPIQRGFLESSDAALGGGVTWRFYDDCTMNHRLEIIAELTYAQYDVDYGEWSDEHTLKTSVSVSAVLGDGYEESYDYKTWGATQYRGSAIDEGYDASNSRSTTNPTIYAGTLYYDTVSPEGEEDPYWEFIEYSYSGYLTEGYDEHDWYKVYITYTSHYEDNSAYIRLDVPEGADFDLRVVDSSTDVSYYSTKRGSATDEVIIPISPTPTDPVYYIEANVYNGSGEYILTAYAVYQHFLGYSGGTGCPFVSTWNGTQYMKDNNLLPASEHSSGADVTDHYVLQQPLAFDDGKYSVTISEFENEHSYLDQTKLLAVDHKFNVEVAVSPYGEILTYKNPRSPITAINGRTYNVLDAVKAVDEEYYQGYANDYIILDFGDTNPENTAKLVIRSDTPLIEKSPIYIQTLNSSGIWHTVATIYTRIYWSTDIIDLSEHLPDANGQLKVRLQFVSNDKIDFVGLDAGKQDEFELHYANLVSAVHSEQGNVKTELSESDGVYAELIPGQQIKLAFTLPENQKDTRTYIIYVKGHYYTIS